VSQPTLAPHQAPSSGALQERLALLDVSLADIDSGTIPLHDGQPGDQFRYVKPGS